MNILKEIKNIIIDNKDFNIGKGQTNIYDEIEDYTFTKKNL